MFLNRPIRESLSIAKNILWLSRTKEDQRALEIDFEKIIATLDITPFVHQPFALSQGDMDLSGGVDVMVPIAGINPWGLPQYRQKTLLHVKYVVHDLTVAQTQIALGPSTARAQCYALSLNTTAGLATKVDFYVPPGYYLGLMGTGNAGDNVRDMTVFGDIEPIGPNGFDFGGTYVEFYPQ